MLNGDYEQWVIKLMAEVAGLPRDGISIDSRVYHDLGIYGDDAREFLLEYSEAFEVDMSAFQFANYFPGEPHLLNLLLPGSDSKFVPITVRDLVESAKQKKWVAPI